jgi:NADPH:quinone reductase-like Zn-dependent oxidoreductase
MTAELDLNTMMRKRTALHATSLRGRPTTQKGAVCAAVVDGLWPLVSAGAVRPIVSATFSMPDVAQAHELVERSEHVGKVLLTVPR